MLCTWAKFTQKKRTNLKNKQPNLQLGQKFKPYIFMFARFDRFALLYTKIKQLPSLCVEFYQHTTNHLVGFTDTESTAIQNFDW